MQSNFPTHRLPAFLAACALALPLFASAQTLNRAQEGRMAVGQCYSACIDRAHRNSLDAASFASDLIDLVNYELETLDVPASSQIETIEGHLHLICALAQEHISGMEGCQQGCMDVETAYGVRTSTARTRFVALLNSERKDLADAGLWVNYRRSPTSGRSFEAACTRYMESSSANAEGGTHMQRAAAAAAQAVQTQR